MSKNGIRVEEFNIYSLGAEAVSYHLKDIHTLAVQVTAERIGGIALELGVELRYNNEFPYLNLLAARGPKEEPEEDRVLIVRPDDWLVILWDEIHLFRDPEFRSTFSFDNAALVAEVEARFHQDVRQVHEMSARATAENPYGVEGNPGGGPSVLTAGSDSEKTQIVASVGELDTGETKLKPSDFIEVKD